MNLTKMKQIPLTKGKFALVDDEDFEFLSQWKWHYIAGGYACRKPKSGMIYMHRLLTRATESHVDHKNGNKLDNRKENLRLCTVSQNLANQVKTRGTSKYKGVRFDKKHKKWISAIGFNSRPIQIGRFASEDEAAKAYNLAAVKYYGEFARLNQL